MFSLSHRWCFHPHSWILCMIVYVCRFNENSQPICIFAALTQSPPFPRKKKNGKNWKQPKRRTEINEYEKLHVYVCMCFCFCFVSAHQNDLHCFFSFFSFTSLICICGGLFIRNTENQSPISNFLIDIFRCFCCWIIFSFFFSNVV